MYEKEYSEEKLEEELDKAFRLNEKKINVFKIIGNEIDALDRKEERMKAKLKPNKDS